MSNWLQPLRVGVKRPVPEGLHVTTHAVFQEPPKKPGDRSVDPKIIELARSLEGTMPRIRISKIVGCHVDTLSKYLGKAKPWQHKKVVNA